MSDLEGRGSGQAGVSATIGLLEGWRSIEPSDAVDRRHIASELESALVGLQESIDAHAGSHIDVASLVGEATGMFQSLASAGVVLFAWWADVARDRGQLSILMASLSLAIVPAPPSQSDTMTRASLDVLAGDDAGIPSTGAIPRRSVVDLGGTPALRVIRADSGSSDADSSGVRQVLVQYIVPIHDAPAVAVLTFATPSVQYADQLQPMFDDIAGTLSISAATP